MKISERYASAIRSSNLDSDERTTYSDSDVLGAYGLASREHPLAVALERLFSGDNSASAEIVEILAQMAWKKARGLKVKLVRVQAEDLARACLAWHRDGRCRPCGGHGVMIIPGTVTLGVQECKACKGTARRPFEAEIQAEHRGLAGWLIAEMEREQSRAGPAAMAWLAPRLEL